MSEQRPQRGPLFQCMQFVCLMRSVEALSILRAHAHAGVCEATAAHVLGAQALLRSLAEELSRGLPRVSAQNLRRRDGL